MRLVPTKLTPEMMEAAMHAYFDREGGKAPHRIERIYRAILNAAPCIGDESGKHG